MKAKINVRKQMEVVLFNSFLYWMGDTISNFLWYRIFMALSLYTGLLGSILRNFKRKLISGAK